MRRPGSADGSGAAAAKGRHGRPDQGLCRAAEMRPPLAGGRAAPAAGHAAMWITYGLRCGTVHYGGNGGAGGPPPQPLSQHVLMGGAARGSGTPAERRWAQSRDLVTCGIGHEEMEMEQLDRGT